MILRLLALLPLLVLCGCKPMSVHIGTEEPIKVDIKMKMDVYQHEVKGSTRSAETRTIEDPEAARRVRMAEIQALKNSRLVGEDHRGLLVIRDLPAGEYGGYVKKTVEAENGDRTKLMEKLARDRGVPMAEIERRQAELFRQSSFPGEWYEEQNDSGGFVWKQKP